MLFRRATWILAAGTDCETCNVHLHVADNNPRRTVSDATAQAIDKEVRALVDTAHDQALTILRQNMALLETISQKILEKEVIEGDELKEMLDASVMPEAIAA